MKPTGFGHDLALAFIAGWLWGYLIPGGHSVSKIFGALLLGILVSILKPFTRIWRSQ